MNDERNGGRKKNNVTNNFSRKNKIMRVNEDIENNMLIISQNYICK